MAGTPDRPSLIRRLLSLGSPGDPAVPTNGNGNGHGPHATAGVKGGVVLGPGVIPGVDFFSPDGTRTIIQLVGGGGSEAERVSAQTAYAAAAYAYVAMRWRASRLAEPPLMVVKEDQKTGDEDWLPKHPLGALLEAPSPDYDMGELLFRTSLYVDQTGMALWVKDTSGNGLPGRLTPFSGTQFEVRSTRDLLRGQFVAQLATGPKTFTPDQVVFFEEPNPADWTRGLSRLDVLMGWLNLSTVARATVRDLLANAVWPSVILQPDHEWNPDDKELAEYNAAAAKYAQPGSRGKPITVLGGGSATVVSARIKDLIPEDVLNRVESITASVFGVPAIVLQYQVGMENSPWSQMAQARKMGYEDTIEPAWRQVEKRLDRQLLRPMDTDLTHHVRFDTTRVRALQANQTEEATVAALWGRAASLNERRSKMGLEPSDDPRADDIPELTTPVPAPFGAPAGDGQDQGTPEQQQAKALEQKRGDIWRLFDMEAKAQAVPWEGAITGFLTDLRLRVTRLASHTLRADKGVDPGSARSFQLQLDAIMDASKPRLKTRTYPLLIQTGTQAVKRLSSRIGLSFSVLEPGLLQYAAHRSGFLADVMLDGTGKAVAKAVQDGLAAGETVGALIKRLETLPDFDRTRAKLVARTETTAAWNGAQRRALSEYKARTGRGVRKSWLSSRDDRVREEHQLLDAETSDVGIPIDEAFSNGLTEPGEPNCRCTLVYSLEAADGSTTDLDEPPA